MNHKAKAKKVMSYVGYLKIWKKSPLLKWTKGWYGLEVKHDIIVKKKCKDFPKVRITVEYI